MSPESEIEKLEKRVDELEKFVLEVQSGKKLFLWLCVSIAGVVATLYYAQNIWKGFHG